MTRLSMRQKRTALTHCEFCMSLCAAYLRSALFIRALTDIPSMTESVSLHSCFRRVRACCFDPRHTGSRTAVPANNSLGHSVVKYYPRIPLYTANGADRYTVFASHFHELRPQGTVEQAVVGSFLLPHSLTQSVLI